MPQRCPCRQARPGGGRRSCLPPVFGPEIAEHGWTEVLLANERGRSRILCRRRKFVGILYRNENDECFGVDVNDLPGGFDSSHTGHADVNENKLWLHLVDDLERLLAR